MRRHRYRRAVRKSCLSARPQVGVVVNDVAEANIDSEILKFEDADGTYERGWGGVGTASHAAQAVVALLVVLRSRSAWFSLCRRLGCLVSQERAPGVFARMVEFERMSGSIVLSRGQCSLAAQAVLRIYSALCRRCRR